MGSRLALKKLRVGLGMSQAEFAGRAGVTRARYQNIESGKNEGQQDFWAALQETYKIPNSEMWKLMQISKGGETYADAESI